jgi:LPS-assembly protein
VNLQQHLRWKRVCRAVWLLLCVVLCTTVGVAQVTTGTSKAETDPLGADRIRTRADSLSYDRKNNVVEGFGNVIVRKGEIVLHADYVKVNSLTEEAEAQGNVRITRGDEEWTGESITFNFKDGTGGTFGLTGSVKPFFVESDGVERTAEGLLMLNRATVSTCKNEPGHRHYHMSARRVEVAPNDFVRARGSVWRFGKVPVFYMPYWFKDLDNEFGWRFIPGHNSRMGTFLLSSYRYRVNPSLQGETHFDVRSERGVAVGQDFKWTVDDVNAGELNIYYANDQEPIDEDEDAATADIDESRYRIRFKDVHKISDKDTIRVYAHKLSDTDITEDFFESEFRDERQPDNYATYTHYDEAYTVNAEVRTRLDDFYESVNRLPEVSLDIFRNQIGDSRFYYQSETAIANLERTFADGSSSEDYDSIRFDTEHIILRPDRHFGFLNVTPRIGYRGTYYSDTRQEGTVSEVSTVTEATEVVVGGVTSTVFSATTSTNSVVRNTNGGADTRNVFEIGFEASFKAFRTWQTADGRSRRHIVEPYANYTFVPEPSLLPDEIYSFDSVDSIDESHFVIVGVRNKIQTKREDGPYDLIDLNVFSPINFNTEDGESTIDSLAWDGELRPHDHVAIDFDGTYDMDLSEVQQFNTEISWEGHHAVETAVEYRYRSDDSNQLYADVTFWPEYTWSYNLYGRYEFEDSQVQEQGGYIQRTLDCLVFRVGGSMLPGFTRTDGSERDDEYRVLLEFWLTAFPQFGLSGKTKS